jgi:hypothetical protein
MRGKNERGGGTVARLDTLSDDFSSSFVARAQYWHSVEAGAVTGALRDNPSPALVRPPCGLIHRCAALTFARVLAIGTGCSGRPGKGDELLLLDASRRQE